MSDDERGRDQAAGAEELGLEQRIRRLEEILTQMESDEVSLERALELFEEGVGHVRRAETILSETELRVEELLSKGKTETMELEDSSTREATFDLEGYLDRERGMVEEALDRAVAAVEPQVDTEVGAAIRHGVMTGGKRLRPILCATAYRACGGDGPPVDVYDLAVTLELIHAYSLVHDDLPCMDDADLRRGSPTTHRAHGETNAVLAGAALIPAAALRALRAARALGRDESAARAVVRALLEASGPGGMVGGQWLDLEGEGARLTGPELDTLHGRKTGALLAASLVVGALAAAADERTVGALRAYGEAIGLAFQIADDVLDATASAEVLGKHPSDATLEKSTYVSLHGLDAARAKARDVVGAALAALDDADLDAPALRALAHYVIERDR